jgi:hypothetical protein
MTNRLELVQVEIWLWEDKFILEICQNPTNKCTDSVQRYSKLEHAYGENDNEMQDVATSSPT